MNPTEEITDEGRAAAGRIAEFRQNIDNGATTKEARQTVKDIQAGPQQSLQVSANNLVNPPRATNLTPPRVPPAPVSDSATVARDLLAKDSENARQLAEKEAEFAGLTGGLSRVEQRDTALSQFGVQNNQSQLEDVQAQLDVMVGDSNLRKTRIEGAAGQTLAGGQRELTQEDREQAVRSQTLASQAFTLRGNIQLGRQLANDALNDALIDREFEAESVLTQIKQLQGRVDKEQQAQLDEEKRVREAELLAISESKEAVNTALQSGATPDEVAQLTNPKLTDADRLSLAQSISARGATEDRNLDVQAQESKLATDRAQRANIFDQINSRQVAAREKANTTTEAGQEAIDKKTADTEQALGLKALATQLLTESGLSSAVGLGFKKSVVGSIPFASGDAIAGSARADFEATAERVANLLTLDNLDLMSGVLSETDIKILETAGSNLRNFDQSEEQYIEEINRIISVMDRTITNNGVSEEQASFFGLADDSDLLEINSIFE